MEDPARQSVEPSGPAEDPPPPPTSTSGQDQSRSESLLDSTADSTSQRRPPPPPSPLTGCYLLIVVGEPHSDRHKEIILQKIAKGFLSWDVNECHVNLEKELQAITVQSPEGEEGRYGERLIQYATENLVTEILIHPQLNTLHQCMRNLLSSFTKHRHIIHAGYTFAGNGSWILQDGTLSISDLIEALHETEVLRVLKAYENSVSIDVHCAPEGDWSTERFQKEPVSKLCNIRINPDDVMTAGDSTISGFIDYLAPFLVPANIQLLLQPTDVVGNIRFTHPTLYVFPGGQGDAALFGINGFNMLVDGGFARKACFWDFARHLDRLDAVLLTRLNNSTVNGISAVLQRKKMNHVYPQIGHFFCNLQDRKIALSPDGDKDKDSLIVSLAEEGQEIVANLRHLALKPHPCYRDGNQVDPVNLYHKVGHGKLDMYVISPARDSQAVKEFLSKWSANDNQLFSNTGKKIGAKGFDFPLQNLVSICALLVWQPANPNDTITRILFPGSTPQHKIFEGLDKLRHLEFLKHPICSARSISPSASTITVSRSLSKTRQAQADAKAKAAADSKPKDSKPIDLKPKPQARPIRKADRSPPKDLKSKTDTNKLVEDKKEVEKVVEKPKIEAVKKEDGIANLINKDEQIEKIEKEIQKIEQEHTIQKIEADIKKIEQNEEETKKVIHKSKYDLKNVKSKVDSRAPSKSTDRKKLAEKKAEGGSPPSTPKKSLVNGTATKTEKSKAAAKPSKSSPSATPAKSTKEANNRKVVEARVVSRASSVNRTAPRSAKKEETPPPATAPAKTERKPISRRPKASSPAKKTPGSPVKATATAKSVKADQDAVKKVKRKIPIDLEKPATDSTVSTPSADADTTILKKDTQDKPSEPNTLAQDAKTDVEGDTEEATKSKEAEESTENVETDEQAVKDEIPKDIEKEPLTNKLSQESAKSGESEKSRGGELPEEEEEYLIVTKEESTEESGKGEESEKENENENDNESLQEDIETKDETEGEGETKKILRDEEDSEKRRKIREGIDEELVEEADKDEKADETTQRIEEVEKEIGETEVKESQEVELSQEGKSALKAEVEEIVESAEEAAKAIKDGDEAEKKVEGEGSEESPQDKSSDRKDNQTRESDLQKLTDLDEGIDLKEPVSKEHKEGGESLPEEKFSTTVETSATTAPTLPEDEKVEEPAEEENKVQLDEIKEVVEEKYIKEETKEDKQQDEVKSRPEQPSTLPKATSPPAAPTQEHGHHRPHPRDIVKTPDEVADLPVHEEVDPGMYSSGEFNKDLQQKHEDELDAKKQSEKSKETEIKILTSKEKVEVNEKATDFKETVKGEAILLDDEDTEETRKLDNADKTLESAEDKLEEEIAEDDKKEEAASVPVEEAKIAEAPTDPAAEALTSKYLDIIDKLEKTSESADNQVDGKISPEKDLKTSAITEEEQTKEKLVAVLGKETSVDTKETSKPLPSPTETAPTQTNVPENVQSGKTTPQEEMIEKRTPSPAVEIGKTSGVPSPVPSPSAPTPQQAASPIEKEIPDQSDRKKSAGEIKLPSGKSTPITSDKDSRQPTPSPVEKDRLSSGKITPEAEHKSDSARSTPAPVAEEYSVKDTIASSGKPTPDKAETSPSPGKVSPHLETNVISERLSPCPSEKLSSGKASPEIKELSGKTTPVVESKDSSRKTSITKEENENVAAQTSSPTEKNQGLEISERTQTPSEKIASGKTSPAPSDKASEKSPSGKTTPALSEKDISGKSSPDIKDAVPSGKSTPAPSEKGTSGKTTPDVPDEARSGNATPAPSDKDASGKSSPNVDEKILSGKATPTLSDKGASGKTTPAPSEKDASGKTTPVPSEKDASGKTTPAPSEKSPSGKTTPAPSDRDTSGKTTPAPSEKDPSGKTTPATSEKEASGKTSPVLSEKGASGKNTPAPSEKDTSGKTTPAPSEKDASGKTSPAQLEKYASGKTTPALSEKDESGKTTPAPSGKDASGKTTPAPSEKEASGKTTPAPSEKEGSGKTTPAPSEKDVSGKTTPAPSEKDASGKTTPAPSEKDASGKTTPAPAEKDASGKTTPAPTELSPSGKTTPAPSDKEASGKTTPAPSEKDVSGKTTPAPSEKDVSGKTTPAPSEQSPSGKATPAPSEKDMSGKTTPAPMEQSPSGKSTPAPSEKDISGKTTPAPTEQSPSGKATPAPSEKDISGKTTPAPTEQSPSGKTTPAPSEKGASGKTTPAPSEKDVSGKTTPAPSEHSPSGKTTPAPSEKGASGKTTPALSEKDVPAKTSPEAPEKISPLPSGKGTPENITPEKEDTGKITPSALGSSGKITPDARKSSLPSEEKVPSSGKATPLEKISPVCEKETTVKSAPSPIDNAQSTEKRGESPTKEEILKSGQSSKQPSGKATPISEPEKVKSPVDKVASPSAITASSPEQGKRTDSPATTSGKISPSHSIDKKSVADSSGKNTPSDKLPSGKSTPLEKLTNGIGICNDSDELEKGILESERHEKESHISDDISSDEDEELKALTHGDDNEDSGPEEEITRERLQSLAHGEITAATPDSVPESPAAKKAAESETVSESPKLDADKTQKEGSQDQKRDSIKSESPLAIQKDKKDDLNELVKCGSSAEDGSKTSIEPENHAAVKRMLVTASSEDGGTETEICAQGSIRLSKSEGAGGEQGEKHDSSPENSDGDDDGKGGEEFSSLILQARKEYNLQRSRKSSCNSPDRQSPDEEKDPSRKQSREEQASPNQQLTEDSTDTLSTEQSSVIQKTEVNGCIEQTASSGIAHVLSKTKTTSRSETSRMDEADIITITTILTEEREEQEDGTYFVTTTKEVVTKGGKDAGSIVTVNTDHIGVDGSSLEISSKTETEEKTNKTEAKGATETSGEDEEPLSPLSVTPQLSPSPTPGFDFHDYRRSTCQDFDIEAAEEKKSSTSSTIAFTETRKTADEKTSVTETVVKTTEDAEIKDSSRKSSTGSQDEKRTSSKEESEIRLSQGDQDISQREESRRTSASSTISQEDLVSRKDSTRIEELRNSSIELSPLKTTYITSQGSSETGESQLMTSSFYGALPTEDEMILSASYAGAKSDVTSEVRKGKGYESVTEIGPDGEKTERTYFYSTEPEVSMSGSFYIPKGIPEPIPEAPEITPEKTTFVDSFLPEEHIDFAKAVDEHRSARGEDLSKNYQMDLGKCSNGKSTPPAGKQEAEKSDAPEKAKVEPSTSETDKSGKEQKSPAEKEKKDAIEGWGKPLGLPLPPKNTRTSILPGQNISTTSSLSTPSDNSDSITNWGQPMSLPSPAPPTAQNGTADSIAEKTASVAKETPKKEKKPISAKKNVSDNKSSGNNTPNRRSESPVKPTEKRAPSLGRNNKSSNTPIYLDLTYVPHHGNSYYSNVEFFKRIRARYYVFSGTEPSREVYNALLEAKQTWDDKDLEVTIIPTYDTDVLGYWVAENEEVLAKHKIDLSPSASRCTINLQDHETSCSAYRLEF